MVESPAINGGNHERRDSVNQLGTEATKEIRKGKPSATRYQTRFTRQMVSLRGSRRKRRPG
jgi:hypothetical protein